ncbi:sigma-70 family RNA polymerase sigma factor [Puteibacter caeruleilacunae]|nr:sigma-70 family RNA polymerase sigma factor [Puteibacter caeruleilacunae]
MEKVDRTSDNTLVELFMHGDHSALERLIARHKNRIYTYILLIVRNQHLAEDIFQDTFVKVIRSLRLGNYVENGRFISWVLRIAHNLIIDHYRKERNMNLLSNDDTEIDLFNSAKFSDKTIEQLMVSDQISKEVKMLIRELPFEQKQVVILRHYVGLSFKEISDQTGVSINTSLGRMRYALINMRKLIEEKNLSLTGI